MTGHTDIVYLILIELKPINKERASFAFFLSICTPILGWSFYFNIEILSVKLIPIRIKIKYTEFDLNHYRLKICLFVPKVRAVCDILHGVKITVFSKPY